MGNISTIKGRILQFIDFKGITKEEFYRKTEISASNFKGANMKSEIGGDKIVKISTIYPEINLDWLISGEGEIEKQKVKEKQHYESVAKSVTKSVKNEKYINSNTLITSPEGIPLIPIDAMAGFGSGETQIMEYDAGRYVVPEFTEINVDFMIRVKGSSMSPKYSSGDLVACKKLYLNDIFFQWNKVYVLDTDQGALIKRVRKGSDVEHISLVSENQSYDPFELHMSKIYAVALVVGVIRLE